MGNPVPEFSCCEKQVISFPSVGLKVTGACRLNCPFCCEPDRTQAVYPLDNFIKITNFLRESGTERLCFTGGDPLLYPSILELLKHTKKLGFFNLLLTSDGELLKNNYLQLLPFLSAVRFSVHGEAPLHNKTVGNEDGFKRIEEMIDLLAPEEVDCYVTTVATSHNISSVPEIARWCFSKGIKRFFIFGIMKSGNGELFVEQGGEVSKGKILEVVTDLISEYSASDMDIIYYDYAKNAECILVYGDGRIVIDPYPVEPSYQLDIGNVLTDSKGEILSRFNNDSQNVAGYKAHLESLNI